ncbi:MAG: 4-hydroxybutyrate--acetyl-CoA CoA transferase [Firmicutes bacterium]|nr:4-hydroxybutyrate--acetyl-CoA CoA transferase [Bacillota bacterium]
MPYADLYRSKVMLVEEAVRKIKSRDTIVCAAAGCEPAAFLSNLHQIREQVADVSVITGVMGGAYRFFTDPSMFGHFQNESWMYTDACRAAHASGTVSYLPLQVHDIAHFLISERRPYIYAGCASPMDKNGYLSLSLCIMSEKDLLEQADWVILEVNPNCPRTLGDTHVHISQVDFLIESDRPIPTVEPAAFGEKDKLIGEYVADLVEDGSTIQLGFGSIPGAVAQCLKDKRDLGVHSGMINDSILDLYEAGAVTNRKKTIWKDKIATSWAVGSQRLFDFIDDNPAVEFIRGSIVNDPAVIAKNYQMISVNTANELDLTGQCNAESIGPRQFSGTGGHKEWLAGTAASRGGKSILAFHSTTKNDTISRIVPYFEAGTVVTSTRTDIHYIVTEYGVANLRGRSIRERVAALISIAHPDFRDRLRYEADKRQIW